MEGFFTWCIRNPAILLAGVAFTAGATQVVPWGLSLSAVCVCVLFAYLGGFVAGRLKLRRIAREEAEARRIEMERKATKGKYMNWMNQNDERTDFAA